MGRKWVTRDDDIREMMPVKLRGKEALIELVNTDANGPKGSYGGSGGPEDTCSF